MEGQIRKPTQAEIDQANKARKRFEASTQRGGPQEEPKKPVIRIFGAMGPGQAQRRDAIEGNLTRQRFGLNS